MISLVEVFEKKDYLRGSFEKTAFSGGAFLQSWEWGEFLIKNNNSIRRFLILKNNIPLGFATLIIKKVFFLKYADCPFGPDINYQKTNQEELEQVFKELGRALKKDNCSFIRFNPPLPASTSFKIKNLEKSQGKTKQPEKTMYLLLKVSLPEILKKMKPKTRYNINLAQRKGVLIKKEVSPQNLAHFLKLNRQTSKRDNFNSHLDNYYRNLVATFGKKGLIQIYTAYYEKEPLASNLVVFYGSTVTYLYGASSDSKRNLMPTYLLQFQTICDAQKLGFAYYDFWGIDEKRWAGVTRFKSGFRGETMIHKTTYEYPLKKISYFLYKKSRYLLRTKKIF